MKKLIAFVLFASVAYGQSGLPYNKWGTVGTAWVKDTVKIGRTAAPTTAAIRFTAIHDAASTATDSLFLRFVAPSASDSGTHNLFGNVTMLRIGQSVTLMMPLKSIYYWRKGSTSGVPFKVLAQVE